MRPRLAFALLFFLALLALAVSIFDGEGRAAPGYELGAVEETLGPSFPVDAPTAAGSALAVPSSSLADDPWPRQELVKARRERRQALEVVAQALDRARQRQAAGDKPPAR